MNYTIQQLNYLMALDTYRSFSKAAEKCYVSQPTLSMQIKKLENDLNIDIIDRRKNPIEFTEVGREVVARAREALGELKNLEDFIISAADGLAGELRLGIIPTLAPYIVPQFLGNFIRQYPNIRLKITEYKTDEIRDQLKSDRLDVGLLATPLHDPSIRESVMFYEQLLCYMHEDLSTRYGNQISIEDVMDEKLWILSEGNCFRNQTFNLCSLNRDNFPDRNFSYESGSLEALIHLTDKEGGCTIIPELMLDSLRPEQLDRVKFINKSHPVREVSIITLKRGIKSRLISKLTEVIKESIPQTVLKNTAGGRVEIYPETLHT